MNQLIIRPSAKSLEQLKLTKDVVKIDVGTSVKLLAGNRLQLICHLKSEEDVEISWLKDGVRITESQVFEGKGNVLSVRRTDDAEKYRITCVVSRPSVQSAAASITSWVDIVGKICYYMMALLFQLLLTNQNSGFAHFPKVNF